MTTNLILGSLPKIHQFSTVNSVGKTVNSVEKSVFPLKIAVGKSEGGEWDFSLFRCVVGNFSLFSHQTFPHENFPQPMCSGKNFPLLINTVENFPTILKVGDLPLFFDCTM